MMRHVSRTQRVELDRLSDRINLDPKIHIKYVDTTNQLADLLAEGSFTRDEWCHLLCFVDVMDLSTISRSHFRSVEKATTISKRIQERKKEEEPAVAKPRSVCSMSTSLNSCVQGNIPESSRVCGKVQRKIEIQLQTIRLDHHNLQVPEHGYVETFFTNLRKRLNQTEDDEVFHLKTNVLIWGLFMSTSVKSAIHLGLVYDQNLISCQNTNFEGIKDVVRYLFEADCGVHLVWCMTSLRG